MDELQAGQRRSVDALASAVAASLVVHSAILAFLFAAGWGPGSGAALWRRSQIDGPLEVVLAATQLPAERKSAGAAVAIPPAPTELPPPHEAVIAPRDLGRPSSSDSQGETGTRGRGRAPRVSIDDRVPRARFEEAFESGALVSFPAEVESPVKLPGKIEVPYPRSALEARREGTVLAFAIVDRQGVVEQTSIVAGEADFNEAVRATLAKTRLIPARDGGKPVPFYIMLKFDFRLGDRGDSAAVSATGN